jgi:hypothetical protein
MALDLLIVVAIAGLPLSVEGLGRVGRAQGSLLAGKAETDLQIVIVIRLNERHPDRITSEILGFDHGLFPVVRSVFTAAAHTKHHRTGSQDLAFENFAEV